jgi:hypothetical protein
MFLGQRLERGSDVLIARAPLPHWGGGAPHLRQRSVRLFPDPAKTLPKSLHCDVNLSDWMGG